MRFRSSFFILLILAATPIFAQNAELGLWVATSQVGDTDEIEASIEFDNGLGFGVSLNQYWGNLSGELSATALSQEGRITSEALADIDIGDLDIIPITATLQFHFARRSAFSPYIGGGVAYILADDLQSEDLDVFEIGPVEVQDEFTWALQAGADINLSSRFAIGLDVKYIAYTPESAAEGEQDPIDLDLNPLIYSAGIKLRF
jgi:outer membrane protein W